MTTHRTLVIVQPKLPAYRWSFFEQIARDWPGRVLLIYGEDQSEGPLASLHNDCRPGTFERQTVPWTHCLGRWFLAIGPLIAAVVRAHPGVLVLPGDINQPAVHLLLLLARVRLGIPVVCIGQHRRSGARPLVTGAKPIWHRAFNGLVLYNQREYLLYRQRFHYPAGRITYLNNGLDQVPPAPTAEQLTRRHDGGPFLCLGRLERKNHFALSLAAYARYRAAGGRRQLVVIGDGSEGPSLRAAATDGVCFLGAIYHEEDLGEQLRMAFAMVHPYGIGLSLNAAFGHGCPVICCRDPAQHMPEFWLWAEGANGFGFEHHPDSALVAERLAGILLTADRLAAPVYAAACQRAHRSVRGMTTGRMAARTLGLLHQLTDAPPVRGLTA